MSAIRILPEQLANQIAAGEVVERPASVVKELLENALDAGAREITVQVEGNGTRLIRVIDDGGGMDHDDVLLSLERHATSKLVSAEQLGAITSLGFRGEAIPSIASVSRLTITSRQAGASLGTVAEVRHGTVVRVHEAGGAPGTTMEVRDLFGNVPARRKFLKSTATELSHIEEAVKNYALVRPEVGFAYTVDDRTLFQWPGGVDTLEGRTLRLLGRRAGQGALLLAVDSQDAMDDLAISGYLLAPEETPATGARLRIFVNGRVVKDRMVAHAVGEGLHNFLLTGRSPAGVLLLTIAPQAVDVNVHPTKQEVRFRHGQAVHQAVAQAVRQAVVRFQETRKESLFGRATPAKPTPPTVSRPIAPAQVREPQPLFRIEAPNRPLREDAQSVIASPTPSSILPPAPESVARPVETPTATAVPLRLLGQVAECYLLCESEGGLLVVDQHAAHERLLFEELRQRYANNNVARQQLLFPKVLECTLKERQLLEENGPELQRLGLEVEAFGGDSFVVKAVPAIMGTTPAEEVVAAILNQLGDEGGGRGSQRVEAVLASMACKAAVKAGQRLTPQEMEHLLQRMHEANIFSHCPHGRPVARRFTPDDLKKWFNRT